MNICLQGKANKLAVDYYRLIDDRGPIEQLNEFFCKDGFEIIKGDLSISSFEDFALWYDNNKQDYVECDHTIERLDADTLEDGTIEVTIWMDYRAKTKRYEKVQVHAVIKWHLIDTEDGLKIFKYTITK